MVGIGLFLTYSAVINFSQQYTVFNINDKRVRCESAVNRRSTSSAAGMMAPGNGAPDTGVLLMSLIDVNTLAVKSVSNMTASKRCRGTVSRFTMHFGSVRMKSWDVLLL